MPKNAVIVCQTPFQFYNAIVISELISIPIDLWLIDKHMERFFDIAKKAHIWKNIYTASKVTEGNKFVFFYSILKHQNRIKKYLKDHKPDLIYVFADNNEFSATFVKYGKSICDSLVILVEEGTTVYNSPFRVKASLPKFLLRKILGIGNPRGYFIGWSPNIDKVVVSNKKLAHPEYLQDRIVIEWPKTKFPSFAADIFLKNIDVSVIKNRILYLGQPLVEMGVLPKEVEDKLINLLDRNKEVVHIKQHPFEEDDKFIMFKNLQYLPEELRNIPVEVLFDILEPKSVISYFSGAGINFSLRNQKDSVFFLPKVLPDSYKNFIMDNFSNIDNIHIVNDFSTLEAIVVKLTSTESQKEKNFDENLSKWKKAINETITI